MLNLVIAETEKHANALILWLGLEDDDWLGVAYGSTLTGTYTDVLLVRPLSGIREEHGEWFLEKVVPLIEGEIDTLPVGWRPEAEAPVESEFAQRQVWA